MPIFIPGAAFPNAGPKSTLQSIPSKPDRELPCSKSSQVLTPLSSSPQWFPSPPSPGKSLTTAIPSHYLCDLTCLHHTRCTGFLAILQRHQACSRLRAFIHTVLSFLTAQCSINCCRAPFSLSPTSFKCHIFNENLANSILKCAGHPSDSTPLFPVVFFSIDSILIKHTIHFNY